MKKSLVLAMAMALGVTASAYAANPFSDVPAGHWAYDSVAKLAAAGVVDGYADGAFDGDKLMTRYEMAQIVAKAMAKGANVDKLAAEFADELDTLGVRVAKLEKGADAVKITGEVRYAYADHDVDHKEIADGNYQKLRSRLWFTGQVNEDWTYTGMLQNEQDFDNDAADETTTWQRAYLNGKLGGAKVLAGRYNLKVAEGNVYDNRFDGVQLSYGKDVKLTAGYGKATSVSAGDTYYAEASTKLGVVDVNAGYYKFEWADSEVVAKSGDVRDKDGNYVSTNGFAASGVGIEDTDIWQVSANMPLAKDLKFGAMYLKGDDQGTGIDDDGYVLTLAYKGAKASTPGSWGLTAKYYDQGATTYIDHTMNAVVGDAATKITHGLGFKGYGVFANYTFAKNIVGQVEYYDLENKEVHDVDMETLWAQVVFTF